ncbi:hypothetical protein GCM10009830_19230 [Glycomyces endophyticus]|uniref:Uncharacterized protein n=1 Tax=Glycomyces endophyticus TaxID=480996 RepID=A0ABN2GL60_9ACTN
MLIIEILSSLFGTDPAVVRRIGCWGAAGPRGPGRALGQRQSAAS